MITQDMYLLTIEMTKLGVSRNAADCLSIILMNLHHKRINDPVIVIKKDDFQNLTNIKTLRTLTKHLVDLNKHKFVELENHKDHFVVNIMPFLVRLNELETIYNERMKDVKHSYLDQ